MPPRPIHPATFLHDGTKLDKSDLAKNFDRSDIDSETSYASEHLTKFVCVLGRVAGDKGSRARGWGTGVWVCVCGRGGVAEHPRGEEKQKHLIGQQLPGEAGALQVEIEAPEGASKS